MLSHLEVDNDVEASSRRARKHLLPQIEPSQPL